MAQDEMPGDLLAFRGELDLAVAADAEIAAASHAFECGGDGGRRDAQVLCEPGADGRLLFLDEFPDSFKIIFLGDAGFFAAQVASCLDALASRISSAAKAAFIRCGFGVAEAVP